MAQNRLPIIGGIIAVISFLIYSATFIVSSASRLSCFASARLSM
jgi:hypothetical protein